MSWSLCFFVFSKPSRAEPSQAEFALNREIRCGLVLDGLAF